MSLWLEMLQVARRAPKLLGNSTPLVRDFLLRQAHPGGGWSNRGGEPDLYYTSFGLAAMAALDSGTTPDPRGPAPMLAYIDGFGGGSNLDFVHLCSLARCRAALAHHAAESSAVTSQIIYRLEQFRSEDGGYHSIPGNPRGTAYGAFLALGAYQDLQKPLPRPDALAVSVQSLGTSDGGWTNERLSDAPARPERESSSDRQQPEVMGATNATAAAITVLRHLGAAVPATATSWLLARVHPQGGFRAAPSAPIPDLLSTATALHALASLQAPLEAVREPCLGFIDSLWSSEGGFYGHWGDHHLDCEYTFYGLLALGHLT